MKNELKVFENSNIRSIYDEEQETYYFSVVDIVAILIEKDYQSARKYWNKLSQRLRNEGSEQTVTNCHQLKLQANDGKMRKTDVAAHRIPVSVESQSYKLSLSVKHGASGVSARDVVVRQEAELHFAAFFILVRAEIAFFKKSFHFRFHLIFIVFVTLCYFFEHTRHGGKVVLMAGRTGIVVYESVAQAHG